ncbi:MAG: hypothetical protein HeimC3_03350 [Candidatus Heimdallarchaeota archaeon LC_3]|nr:MAG: hypothetical protein HeimC3_03350 [Candidatus Heimdallarchaeota archaeon LC_3]
MENEKKFDDSTLNQSDLESLVNINEVVHSPAKLAILLFLLSRNEATFSIISKGLKLTRGNLSTHLKKLDQAKLVLIEKKFMEARPTTIVSITDFGRKQVLDYAQNLSTILRTSLQEQNKKEF